MGRARHKRHLGEVDLRLRLPVSGKFWTSQSFLPDVVVAFCMNHAQDHSDGTIDQEDDSIGKAIRKHPPHGVSAVSNSIAEA
jgi:hypothetical protein